MEELGATDVTQEIINFDGNLALLRAAVKGPLKWHWSSKEADDVYIPPGKISLWSQSRAT